MRLGLKIYARHLLMGVFVLLGGMGLISLAPQLVSAQGVPPPAPVVYSGKVTVGGEPAIDGLLIYGRVTKLGVTDANDSKTQPTENGSYNLVAVGQTMSDQKYLYGTVTFHISGYDIQADQSELFYGGPAFKDLDLTFPILPEPIPTPTPEPSPVAVVAPIATPEPTVVAVVTPEPLPTPDIEAVIAAAVEAAVAAREPDVTTVPEETPDINQIVAAAVAEALATETPLAEPEPDRPGGVCSRNGSPDLGLIIGGGVLLGLVGRQRFWGKTA